MGCSYIENRTCQLKKECFQSGCARQFSLDEFYRLVEEACCDGAVISLNDGLNLLREIMEAKVGKKSNTVVWQKNEHGLNNPVFCKMGLDS